jgi:hypothetical protein
VKKSVYSESQILNNFIGFGFKEPVIDISHFLAILVYHNEAGVVSWRYSDIIYCASIPVILFLVYGEKVFPVGYLEKLGRSIYLILKDYPWWGGIGLEALGYCG